MDSKDREINRLKHRIAGLEKTLQVVSGHSGRIEKNLNQLFGAVSDTMPVPMLITSKAGDILFSNQNARDTFGYSKERFQRITAAELYENPENRASLLKTLDARAEVRGFEVLLKKADGGGFPASLFSRRIVFEGRTCVLTVVYDLSDIKTAEKKRLALEKQLRQTQKMEAIGALASGIAHDFGNILTVIFGRLQLAELRLPEGGKTRAHISEALSAAERAKAMIMQILTFCRQSEEERKPFQIGLVVAEAARMLQTFASKTAEVRVRIASKSSVILGDPTQIHQVVMNLGANAVYALKERNGVIDISVEDVRLGPPNAPMVRKLAPGDYVRLSISDNGPGIAGDVIDRIFDPFFTTKPPGEGAGMGLSAALGIVEAHNGAVLVDSEPGKGTAFHCYFPLIPPSETTAAPAPTDHAIKGGRERILVVDDEESIVDACAQMLESLGYHVTGRVKSADALALIRNRPDGFDAVVTDEAMPDISGRVLTSEILKIRPDMPVVIITGLQADDQRLLAAGAAAAVRKPFNRGDIGTALREALDKRKEKDAERPLYLLD